MIEHKKIKGLSFDDILLPPGYSDITSRSDVDTSTLIGPLKLEIPFVSSPMDTVTESEMAIAIGKAGGLGVIHRFMSPEEQAAQCNKVIDAGFYCVPAIGIGDAEKERLNTLMYDTHHGIDMISIDVANAHTSIMKDMILWVKEKHPELPIMVGNIATFEAYMFLTELGVDAIRVGIGSGAICKTRIMSGYGIPLLSSIADCARARNKINFYSFGRVKTPSIIADGGIRYPADVVKSIIGGADAVMCGGLFAGTSEAPGSVIQGEDGSLIKKYRGSASAEFQREKRGGVKKGTCSEGVSTFIPFTGSVDDVLFGEEGFVGGLRSGMTYANCRSIDELKKFQNYVVVTGSSLEESHAYGTKK